MNQVIDKKARTHLLYLCTIAAPLWLAIIPFDYYYRNDHFFDFLIFRIIGTVLSLIMIYLLKKGYSVMKLQLIFFAYYVFTKTYMLMYIDPDAVSVYFQGYTMTLMFIFFILVLRPIEMFLNVLIGISSIIFFIVYSDFETSFIFANGGYVFLTVMLSMLAIGILRFKGVLRDAILVEKIKEAEVVEKLNTSLAASLKEKETLLQEIHHRVKNNMQIISSILRLQNNYVEDQETKVILSESINRIRSMSGIHERLYKFKNFESINFSDYLLELTNEVIYTYKQDTKLNIEIEDDLADIRFNIKQAIPCGLFVNEIISNAVKYAFKGREKGNLFLSLKHIDGNIELAIGDDGVGFPKDFSIEDSETLGIQLIDSLVDQLDGSLEIKNENGVKFKIVFPLDETKDEFASQLN
ncbi:sensor histidine kinase [Brumimicrobium aurantiacum]|uniref:Sensor histidine kinase n=1 Tax=Brumimicrobium aurantiacum TaxID=1737063 RepID=A0A3E1F0N8_9FLAO|nr:sensor histidine kinase [Brumimicrobium aurantiacum]RFC55370.1 sensor histidine kinase [Brumimicrobium aurantiacum]